MKTTLCIVNYIKFAVLLELKYYKCIITINYYTS